MSGLDAYTGLTIVQALELARLQRDKRTPTKLLTVRLGDIHAQIEKLPDTGQRSALSKQCAELLASLP